MQPVVTQHLGPNNRLHKTRDDCGAVFVPVVGKAQRPVYSYGPANAKLKDVMFTCPVSAIPAEVLDLLLLWWQCRTMRTLPYAGGLLDQPMIVRLAFPVFEAQMRQVEAGKGDQQSERAAALAVGATLQAVAGGLGGRRTK